MKKRITVGEHQCHVCQSNELEVRPDGVVADRFLGDFTLSLDKQPRDVAGRILLVCCDCHDSLRPLIERGVSFDRKLLRRAVHEWAAEKSTEWATEELDSELHRFYLAEQTRKPVVVGSHEWEARRQYLSERRRSGRRRRAWLAECVQALAAESAKRSQEVLVKTASEQSLEAALIEAESWLQRERAYGRSGGDWWLQRVVEPAFVSLGMSADAIQARFADSDAPF